jgi:uncharacterized protein with ACT and thioredoxin-like domain
MTEGISISKDLDAPPLMGCAEFEFELVKRVSRLPRVSIVVGLASSLSGAGAVASDFIA